MNKYLGIFLASAAMALPTNTVLAEGMIYHEELFNYKTDIQQSEFSSLEITQPLVKRQRVNLSADETLKIDGVFNYFSEINHEYPLPDNQVEFDEKSIRFDFMDINV